MGREIWNGRGDAEGKVYWTMHNGEIVGRPYIRKRASSYLSRWRSLRSLEVRRAAIRATIERDEWMRFRAGETVGSVLRQVEDYLITHPEG